MRPRIILVSAYLLAAHATMAAEPTQSTQPNQATRAEGVATPVESAQVGKEMAEAASQFLATLDADQRVRAHFAFTEPTREEWDYVPKSRRGLPLGAMAAHQVPMAYALLASALSQRGLLKATTIISLEQILAERENNPERRNPGNYYVSIFGEPRSKGAWGWSVEGHHLALHMTVVEGQPVSATPQFFGANPGIVVDGPRQGLQPLAAEENRARALAIRLRDAGLADVIFSQDAPAEIVTRAQRAVEQLVPVGIAAEKMEEPAQQELRALLGEYIGRLRPEMASQDWKKIHAAGFDKIRFAWAGKLEPGQPFYYRVQGPTFLLECANAQNQANHIHTVWRDFAGDFGRDHLGEHYKNKAHRH